MGCNQVETAHLWEFDYAASFTVSVQPKRTRSDCRLAARVKREPGEDVCVEETSSAGQIDVRNRRADVAEGRVETTVVVEMVDVNYIHPSHCLA